MALKKTDWAGVPLTTEYAGAKLGDVRLNARLTRIVEAAEMMPGAAFPQMVESDGELEGIYRFLNNDKVSAERVLGPHVGATLARASMAGVCLIVHDTTELDYAGIQPRAGLGRTSGSDSGFLAHVSLAVCADGTRVPLGVLAIDTFARTGAQKEKTGSDRRRSDLTRESLRWERQVMRCESFRGDRFDAIHVMDREADIYRLMATAADENVRYVIRAAQDRVIELDDEDEEMGKLFGVARQLPQQITREIELSERAVGVTPTQRKRHPKRKARTATVAIGGTTVTLHRPKGESTELRANLEMNLVRVWELNVPAGEPQVEWILLTTEPVQTAEQLECVVDWYRSRWMIEEFFKALKTGCSMEKRQLESYGALVNALAVFSPIAWRMLLMRSLSRVIPDAPAQVVINQVQERLLVARTKRTDSTPMTVVEALYAIAKLGGHLKRNGPPGWQTIGRGFQELLTLEIGWWTAVSVGAANPALERRSPSSEDSKGRSDQS